MAGDWMMMRLDLEDDPAVVAIAQALKVDELVVIGRLWKLWALASAQSACGWLPHFSLEIIDAKVRLPGFASAVASVQWLQQRPGGLQIPNFERWLSESAKKRFKEAERKRKQRSADSFVPHDVGQDADKNGTPILSSSVLSSSPGKERGAGRGGGGEPAPPEASELANEWCFYLTRKRLGSPRDSPLDMAAEFAELIRLGHDPQAIRAEIVRKDRDRGEHFWQFKTRLTRNAGADSAAGVGRLGKVGLTDFQRAKFREKEARSRQSANGTHTNGEASSNGYRQAD